MMMMSGSRSCAASTASIPFFASMTSYPENARYSEYISRLSAKSSTTSTIDLRRDAPAAVIASPCAGS